MSSTISLRWLASCSLLAYAAWLATTNAQTIQFTNVPQTINEGAELLISWTGGDSVSVRLFPHTEYPNYLTIRSLLLLTWFRTGG